MPKNWMPDPETNYADLSYDDILQTGQGLGVVGDGNNPRASGAFDSGPYYEGPNWYPNVMVDIHSLVATDDPRNNKVIRDLEKWMYK